MEGPLFSAHEMDNTRASLLTTLQKATDLQPAWRAAFAEDGITVAHAIEAIAAYVRTLHSGNSAWDRHQAGQADAMSPDALAGKELFFGKANCALCHSGALFTNQDFVNIGAGRTGNQDSGRHNVTMQGRDWKLFRTPSLRDVALTAPYMHDGSLATLAAVVDFYNRGGEISETKDYRIRPLKLSEQEKQQLLSFLHSLTGDRTATEGQ
jgi:cytochrome c peroxidase